ncbi:MAG: cytochrome C oxidase subunit IV family protein [Candidatus Acidiferrum sp.]
MSENVHTEHIVPPSTYIVIISILLCLTGLTVFAAYIDLGRFNIVVALGIATVKATLVVLFFMHAKYGPKRTKLVILAGIFWLIILLFMTLSDYETRVDYRGIRYPMAHIVSLDHSQRP